MSNTVFAADTLYSFTHNMQDVVVVGQVDHVTSDYLYLKDTARVNGEHEVSEKIKISNHKALTYVLTAIYSHVLSDEERDSPQVGDRIIVSLKKDGTDFRLANGLYKVDSLNIETLNVIPTEENANLSEHAKITCYANSRGTITDFIDDDEGNVFYENSKGEQVMIYKNVVVIDSSLEGSRTILEVPIYGERIWGVKEILIASTVSLLVIIGILKICNQIRKK